MNNSTTLLKLVMNSKMFVLRRVVIFSLILGCRREKLNERFPEGENCQDVAVYHQKIEGKGIAKNIGKLLLHHVFG